MAENRSVTVRLFPMWNEHAMCFLVDLVFLAVLGAVWTLIFGAAHGVSVVAVVILVVLFHIGLVWWFVVDRFDDEGVTIIRPWGRRHVPWKDVRGLVYTGDNRSQRHVAYRLRLVLKDNEPPYDRYSSPAALERYATGPSLLALTDLEEDLHRGDDNSQVRCTRRVYAELERHGFPQPPPLPLEFRTPRYTPEEVRRAAAIDFLHHHPVTVTHGRLDAAGTHLLETELPALAHAAGEIHREPTYAIYSFDTAEAAAAFVTVAREVTPSAWAIAPGALPTVEPA